MVIGEAEQPEHPGPSIPTYVMLPLGTISMDNKVAEAEKLKEQLEKLKSAGAVGVMVDCWWGIVEETSPLVYEWSGYGELFGMVRDAELKLQVVMSFHQCGGNVGDDVHIPLPKWVLDVGKENPDIFFTNRAGVRNPESLTFGIDDEPVLQGRTALEIYFDYMLSFRQNLHEFFDDGTITEIEVGMGPCGELRYPSYPESQGWRYPGTGEFQCWEKSLPKSLKREGTIALVKALQFGNSLRRLDLRDKIYGPDGWLVLADTLKLHTELREVYLSDVDFADEGVVAVLQALVEVGSNVEVLEVSGNKITGKAFVPLVACIHAMKNLRRLVLSENKLKDKVDGAVSQALVVAGVKDLGPLDENKEEEGDGEEEEEEDDDEERECPCCIGKAHFEDLAV